MSQEEKKNIDMNNTVDNTDSMDRLRAASQRLSSHKVSTDASHVSEDQREERAREAKEKMRENIERAGKEAAERRRLAESKSDYRQGILARENKKVEAAKRERERVEIAEREERARKIEEERELFLKREREENARASEGVLSIFGKIGAKEPSSVKPCPEICETAENDAGSISAEATVPERIAPDIAPDVSGIEVIDETVDVKAEKKVVVVDDSSPKEINDESITNERVSLEIGAASINASYTDRDPESMMIHIGVRSSEEGRRSGIFMDGEVLNIDPAVIPPYNAEPTIRVDISADKMACEMRGFDEYSEKRSVMISAGDEDALREYDRYIESMKRGDNSTSGKSFVGEPLPYTKETQYDVTDDGYPGYDEAAYDPYEKRIHTPSEPYASELGRYVTMGYGNDSDSRAVREYETEMARRENAKEKKREAVENIEQQHLAEAEISAYSYRDEGLDLYAKSRLSKKIDGFYKESAVLLRREKKISSNQRKASPEENVQLIVEKIAIAKELCEMTADVLGACVYIGSGARTGKYKKTLSLYIDKYNFLCDEYESQTGRAIDRIDPSMVDAVMAGRLYQPIQNVYYHGMEDDSTHAGLTPAIEREHRIETEESLVADEYSRYAEAGGFSEMTESEMRAVEKHRSERMGAVRRAAERDLLLISLRAEHQIASLQAKKDVLSYSFDLDKRDRQREIRKIEKRIGKIRRTERKAHDLERSDNSRFYYLAALPLSEEKVKRGARRERLEALRLRLDVLLSERESINERLIALYGGADGRHKKTRVARKAAKIRKKTARTMYKRQRDLAKKIDKIKAPVDMKERAIELLNKRIADASEYEAARYTLRALRPGGRARDELVRTIKRTKKNMRLHDREIKYMIRKLKRHEERYRSDREWAGFLITLTVISVLCVAGWMLFGDKILAYLSELRAYFGL